MSKLQIARELSLPLDAVTQKFAFFGKNGSGKSYAAIHLAELMLRAQAQIIALDPVGVWYGLRLGPDGKSPSEFKIPVFGGLYGDLPLEPGAGALIADVIVDRGISAVIDVSQFEYDTDRARFVTAFAERLFFRKKAAPSALHIFYEEAQEFLPLTPQRGEEKMLHQCLRIGKIGRNYGFGVSIISPRPQEITTKARNLTECVFAFQTNGVHERKAIAEWVKEKGDDIDVVATLPKFKVGEAHAWSPSWLDFSGTVHILEKKTFNASATPKVGAAAIEARPLAPIDIERLRTDMAATIEKAKAEDPAELKRIIAGLNRDITQLKRQQGVSPDLAKDVIQKAVDRAIASERAWFVRELRGAHSGLSKYFTPLTGMAEAIGKIPQLISNIESKNAAQPVAVKPIDGNPLSRLVVPVPVPVPRAQRPDIAPSSSNGDLSRGQKKILNALAEFEAIGVEQTTRHQLGMMAGYNLTGGTGAQHIADLVTAGLAEIPDKGIVRLTDHGRGHADAAAAPTTLSELHERVLQKLSEGQRRIAQHLIEIYPHSISRADLGVAVCYNLTGGTGAQHVADLITVGAAKKLGSGRVAASDLLFPEGLN